MKGFFDKIPLDIEEAASIDGCGLWKTFLLIAIPLVKPGIGATVIYAIVLAWSDYLFPKSLLLTPGHWTLSVGAVSLIGEHTVDWNGLMAMGVIGVLPMVIAFAVLEPFLVSGLTAGATVG
jgi:multiple sugar transport system permease protein